MKTEANDAGTVTHQVIELDTFYGRGLGLQDGEKVSVGFVKNVPKAKQVHVEPASEDDWEILELHPEYVEEQLLSQVRAVSVGQIMSVWIREQTPISLRVLETDPAASCVRLGNDSEVIVAPKTRKSSSAPKELFGGNAEESVPAEANNGFDPSRSVTVEFRSLPAEYLSTTSSSPSSTLPVIYCSPTALEPLKIAGWTTSDPIYISHAMRQSKDALDELDEQERQRNEAEGSTGSRRRDDEGAKPPKLIGLYARLVPLDDGGVRDDHVAVSQTLRNQLRLGRFDRLRISYPARPPVQATKIVARKVNKSNGGRSMVLSGKGAKDAAEQSKLVISLVRDALALDPEDRIVTDGTTVELSDHRLAENPTNVVLLLEGRFEPAGDAPLYTLVSKEAAAKIRIELGVDMTAEQNVAL